VSSFQIFNVSLTFHHKILDFLLLEIHQDQVDALDIAIEVDVMTTMMLVWLF
jgi:hypothetical protein